MTDNYNNNLTYEVEAPQSSKAQANATICAPTMCSTFDVCKSIGSYKSELSSINDKIFSKKRNFLTKREKFNNFKYINKPTKLKPKYTSKNLKFPKFEEQMFTPNVKICIEEPVQDSVNDFVGVLNDISTNGVTINSSPEMEKSIKNLSEAALNASNSGLKVGLLSETVESISNIVSNLKNMATEGVNVNHNIPVIEQLWQCIKGMFDNDKLKNMLLSILISFVRIMGSYYRYPILDNLLALLDVVRMTYCHFQTGKYPFDMLLINLTTSVLCPMAAMQGIVSRIRDLLKDQDQFDENMKARAKRIQAKPDRIWHVARVLFHNGCDSDKWFWVDQPEDEDNFHPQMDTTDGLISFFEIVTGYLFYVAFNMEYKGDKITGFLRNCFELKKAKEGLTFLFESFFSIMSKIVDFVKNVLGMEIVNTSMFPEIDCIYEDLKTKIDYFRKGGLYDYDSSLDLSRLEKRLNNINAKIPNGREFIDYKKRVLTLLAMLKPFISKMERANIHNNGPRREPTAVMIVGPSGIGKTTMLPTFITDIAGRCMPEDKFNSYKNNQADHIYNFIPENEYHDSYHGQYFTVIDEFGAQKDTISTPNASFLASLRMINMWSFPLHMAHLEDKGCTNFLSDFVIATGNISKIKVDSMIEPEAVTRRYEHQYLCVPREFYCLERSVNNLFTGGQKLWARRLDKSKLTKGFSNMDHLEFFPYDVVSGTTTSNSLSYDEVVEKVATFHMISSTRKISMLADHKDYAFKIGGDVRTKFRSQFKPQMEEATRDLERAKAFVSVQAASILKGVADATKGEEPPEGWNVHNPFKNWVHSHYYVSSGQILSDALEKLITSFDELCYDPLNFIKQNPVLTSLTVALPLIALLWKFIHPTKHTPQSFNPVIIKSHAKAKAVAKKAGVTTQMCEVNNNTIDLVTAVLRHNTYKIESSAGQKGWIMFLKGRVFVMPGHYYDNFCEAYESDPKLSIKFTKFYEPTVGFNYAFCDIKEHFYTAEDILGKADIIFCVLPNIHAHRDITNILPHTSNLILRGQFSGLMVRVIKGSVTFQASPMKKVGNVSYTFFNHSMMYSYNIATMDGECGLPVFITTREDKSPKLIGFHSAGNGKTGLSVAMFREDINEVIKLLERNEGLQIEHEMSITSFSEQMDLGGKYVTNRKMRDVPLPTKTKIIKSPLHNAWGASNYSPSMLRKIGDIDPWANARSKYCPVFHPISHDILYSCTNSYIRSMHVNSERDPVNKPRIFTFEESVEGIEGFYKSIPRKTSAGYPYCLDVKFGKQQIFGKEGNFDFTSEHAIKLKEKVNKDIDKMKRNFRCEYHYIDFLKDERRSQEKVSQGKTRLFSAAPVDYTIVCRMYFGDFTRWLISNKIVNGICVGVNPYSSDWHHIATHLKSIGNSCIFGDFSSYDGSLSPILMWFCLKVVESYYTNSTKEERRIRRILFQDVINSRHIAVLEDGTYSYEWMGSNPSGTPLTTFINSICNNIVLRYVVVCSHYQIENSREFLLANVDFDLIEENIRIVTFGDDNGMSIGPELEDITQGVMTDGFAKIGMKYTSEDKTSEIRGTRPLEECTFLKQHFRYEPLEGMFVAPQELESILESPYWTKSDCGDPEAVNNSVDSLLDKLSLWGEEKFNELSPLILKKSKELINHHPQRDTWRLCMKHILSCESEFH